MDRFLSHFTLASTPKGASRFRPPFRQVLAKDGFAGVYAYPSLDAPALECGGQALLAEIDALLGDDAALFAGARRLRDGALGTSEMLNMDAEGRVMLDERLKTSLGLGGRGGVRRARAQVPDLGAGALRRRISKRRAARAAFASGARASGRRGVAMSARAGEPAHVPVLLDEALEALEPRAGGLYVDGTFGAGGYARALLDRGARVIALDRDPSAIRAGAALVAASGGRLDADRGAIRRSRRGRASASASRRVDGVVLDIGVSSMQLDEAERGFSLRFDGPLDMRMEEHGRSAADILRDEDEATIADILYHFGEERAARRIARAIVADREAAPFTSTLQLAEHRRPRRPGAAGELTHPATRTFQALRIAVNDELGELVRGARRGRAPARARRTARGRDLPFARGPDRQAVPRQPLGARTRGLAPACRASRRRAPTFGFRAASRSSRAGGKRRQTRAPARPSCGRRARTRRARGQRQSTSRMLTRLPARRAEVPDVAFLACVAAIAALIGSAAYVYSVKYRTV